MVSNISRTWEASLKRRDTGQLVGLQGCSPKNMRVVLDVKESVHLVMLILV